MDLVVDPNELESYQIHVDPIPSSFVLVTYLSDMFYHLLAGSNEFVPLVGSMLSVQPVDYADCVVTFPL